MAGLGDSAGAAGRSDIADRLATCSCEPTRTPDGSHSGPAPERPLEAAQRRVAKLKADYARREREADEAQRLGELRREELRLLVARGVQELKRLSPSRAAAAPRSSNLSEAKDGERRPRRMPFSHEAYMKACLALPVRDRTWSNVLGQYSQLVASFPTERTLREWVKEDGLPLPRNVTSQSPRFLRAQS